MANILVVDRDAGTRDGLQRLLARAGHDVVTTPFGRVALRLDSNTPFELVLIGRKLPDMDGFRLLRQYVERPLTASVPVIMLLPADTAEDPSMANALGAWDTLQCPPVAVEVLYKVGRAIDESADNWQEWAEGISEEAETRDDNS